MMETNDLKPAAVDEQIVGDFFLTCNTNRVLTTIKKLFASKWEVIQNDYNKSFNK